MCGIAGYFSFKNESVEIKRYLEAFHLMSHRGPDDTGHMIPEKGSYSDQNSMPEIRAQRALIQTQASTSKIFSHHRLAIIDLSAQSHQPFSIGQLTLTYNGEIYNYLELREQLQRLGVTFTTEGDTEVLLRAYIQWGIACFNKFNGMWACSIFDANRQEVILARDRYGVKPLYYRFQNKTLAFGSEVKFLAKLFDIRNIQKEVAYQYLVNEERDCEEDTLFETIKDLPPGHVRIFSEHEVRTHNFEKRDKDFYNPPNVSSENLKELVTSAVRLRLRSDVEVGTLLSGGLDSTIIASVVAGEPDVKEFSTFTATYQEKEFSEEIEVRETLEMFPKIKGHFISIKPSDLDQEMAKLIFQQDFPIRSFAPYAQYKLYEFIKHNSKAKVLLNGQGSDELFAGYRHFIPYLWLDQIKANPFSFIANLRFNSHDSKSTWSQLVKEMARHYISASGARSMLNRWGLNTFHKSFEKERPNLDPGILKNQLKLSFYYTSLREYLRLEDRNSMAHSLEARLPFMDYRIVNFAWSIQDSSQLNRNGFSKFILREAFKDQIPLSIYADRRKRGFITPQATWLKQDFRDTLLDTILDGRGILDISHNRLARIFAKDKNSNFLWNIYIFKKWADQFSLN